MAFYPELSEDSVLSIKLVMQMLEKDPEYLDAKECQYSPTVKEFLRGVAAPKGMLEIPDLFEGGMNDEPEVLDRQIQKILNRMDAMEGELGGFEPNERMTFFKTRTAMLEKLISLREKVTNIREMMDFQAIVLATLEEVSSPEQIKTFMERLNK